MTLREFHPPCPPAGARRVAEIPTGASREERRSEPATQRSRLRLIVDRHYDFVWRTVRYLGVSDANAEDAAQEVLCVLARRLHQIVPGAEMSFLFSTAVRVASEARRAVRRRPAAAEQDVDALEAPLPTAEALIDERRAQRVLRDVLDGLPVDLRLVFVLFELEELTLAEVAVYLGIPAGTAASRLRRARENFRNIVRRMQVAQGHGTREGGQ
ncbi:MAG: sigma-70 family RNA polymerase sigma factor [Myxococcota bacterium]|nr:sigma-70 family RNA polymerase sigma factor [Myxococcota bacterium]